MFDLRSLPVEKREAEANRILLQETRKPFNIAQDVTLRAVVVRLVEDEHWVLFVTHHIAWDVSSKAVLYRELASFYGGYITGDPVPLADLPVRYSDFAAWQRQRLQGAVLDQQAAYWREQLGSAARVLDLPTDRPRPPVQSFRGAKHFFTLSKSLTDAAKALSHLSRTQPALSTLGALARNLLRSESAASSRIEGVKISHRRLARASYARAGKWRILVGDVAHALDKAVRADPEAAYSGLSLGTVTDALGQDSAST